MSDNHNWKFFRAGGFDQVNLTSAADLANLDQLDQKLWVALACPTSGLEFDAKTFALIDTDKDGRVRAPEVIAAAKWACASLKNPDELLKGSASLALNAINDTTPEGRQLLASAKQILVNLGKADATSIAVEDASDTVKIFAQTKFNGDGIVPAEATDDAALKVVIADIIACLGAETDRSGKPGVSQAKVDQFFAEAAALSDWWKKAESEAAILPLGEATTAAAAATKAVKAKLDDYFTRCRLAAFDARAINALNREEKEYLAMAARDLTITNAEIAGFPLARIEADKPSPLASGINPAWAAAMAKFHSDAVKPILGEKAALTEADWSALLAKLGPFECWSSAKPAPAVEKLGLKRVREILGGKSKEQLAALIAKDKALEPEAAAIGAVDKLVRLNRDLFKLANNFVSFRDFYGRKEKAIFQAGTLYLDQRSCDLCLSVEDAGRHASMAGLAGAYLAYCDCVRKATGEKRQIVAAFTDGDADNLMVGRNGVFYDRKGQDWDATITKILANPISIREAFWSPYKKLVRMIEEMAAKRAAAAEAESDKKLAAAATATTTADKAKPAEPKKLDVGVVAALGVGVGAITTAVGYFLGLFKGLPVWQIPLIIVGVMLIISAPSMMIAWLKLRKRNLGPILDANGWAVNAKATLNVPFGKSLTSVATLPPGSERNLVDPYQEKSSPWPRILIVLVVLLGIGYFLNTKGKLNEWFGVGAKVEATTPAAPSTGTPPEAPPAK